ncbi:MAG: hypothetical protein EZS26_000761 [Candidatus Ordinivivax streblomastigis]|uniref:Uncharacterized protein n=1 Tax=Candidatus Ordinivivax streblomastigis TaxID=2540710 RepID=A0A5M8P448_9BACT|nr:MAG: hypothetical protein EZS26_000761 [Candidatus Ordinivivax streblomastigis]
MKELTLFDLPEIQPKADILQFPGKHCRDCEHCKNLNYYSTRYWYCTITPNNRTSYGVKAVKRMNKACNRFQQSIND